MWFAAVVLVLSNVISNVPVILMLLDLGCRVQGSGFRAVAKTSSATNQDAQMAPPSDQFGVRVAAHFAFSKP